jgi:hypothetical protein
MKADANHLQEISGAGKAGYPKFSPPERLFVWVFVACLGWSGVALFKGGDGMRRTLRPYVSGVRKGLEDGRATSFEIIDYKLFW